MPDGGRLRIETGNTWLDEAAAKLRELPPGQYVTLVVSDTGSGMPPDVVAQAFDPFFTTKPIGQGTGLGLSMIHGFMRQSGGQVHIESAVDRGTTVTLYFPRHMGELEATGAVEPAGPAEAVSGETVLVIDDEYTIRALITDALEEAGYRVLSAGTAPAASRSCNPTSGSIC